MLPSFVVNFNYGNSKMRIFFDTWHFSIIYSEMDIELQSKLYLKFFFLLAWSLIFLLCLCTEKKQLLIITTNTDIDKNYNGINNNIFPTQTLSLPN